GVLMNRSIWRSNSIGGSYRLGARSRRQEPGRLRSNNRSAAKNAAIRITGRGFRSWETRVKSEHASRYSTARVSKRPPHRSAACLRARYCTGVSALFVDLNFDPRQLRDRKNRKRQRGLGRQERFCFPRDSLPFFTSSSVCNAQSNLIWFVLAV